MRIYYNTIIKVLFVSFLFLTSCSSDDNIMPSTEEETNIPVENNLTEYQLSVVSYFKEVALGFEFGNASRITRKWNSNMKIFIEGTPSTELRAELDRIINEINNLVLDGFKIEIVDDANQSNFHLFFGTGSQYASLYPELSDLINNNWGLFTLFWNDLNELTDGHMYVDISRTNDIEQKHLLREELTQSLSI